VTENVRPENVSPDSRELTNVLYALPVSWYSIPEMVSLSWLQF